MNDEKFLDLSKLVPADQLCSLSDAVAKCSGWPLDTYSISADRITALLAVVPNPIAEIRWELPARLVVYLKDGRSFTTLKAPLSVMLCVAYLRSHGWTIKD